MTDLLELALSIATNDVEAPAVQQAKRLLDAVVSGGAVVELHSFDPHAEPQQAGVWLRGYMSDTPAHARTLANLRKQLQLLPEAKLYGEVQIRHLAQQDWAEAWKEHYHALRVGEHIVVSPTWEQPALQPGDIVVWMEPGMAFGTGTHASTRLALQLLERHLQPGMEMLDVGTGSGILAIAALHLGADHVWATDTSADAIATARKNTRINGVEERITLLRGSTPSHGAYPLLCVNILADTIAELILQQHLAQFLAKKGVMVLSGIIEERRHVVDLALAARQLQIVET
ncbi:MAG: 50S ribosomal protein L11 methyltransferase, partial [Chloroflexi bacterium]|nr:50S ribosomal protein L11 methyltransferase [Chloroflexota bacterium]